MSSGGHRPQCVHSRVGNARHKALFLIDDTRTGVLIFKGKNVDPSFQTALCDVDRKG